MNTKKQLEARLCELESELQEAFADLFLPGGQERAVRLDQEAINLCDKLRKLDNHES